MSTRFAYLEQKCSQLAVAEDTDNRIAIILDEAESFVAQLADVYDFVEPCFPPSYKIFTFIFKQYHQQLDSMLLYIGCCAEQLANADILRVGRLALCLALQMMAHAVHVCCMCF